MRAVISPIVSSDPAMLIVGDHALFVRRQVFHPDIGDRLVRRREVRQPFAIRRDGHKIMFSRRVKDRPRYQRRPLRPQAGRKEQER